MAISNEEYTFGQPQFLTNKLQLNSLSKTKNIYDYQLRDHFLNVNNLNVLQCTCQSHKHNKDPCSIALSPVCTKCDYPTRELISFQSLLFHPELRTKKMTRCCTHIHTPPCKRCINCQTYLPCIVTEPFECDASTDVVCHLDNTKFAREETKQDIMVHEHIYNTKSPIFYFCFTHVHRHKKFPNIECKIQTFKCCDDAVMVKDFNKCFVVTVLGPNAHNMPNALNKGKSYVIFDPRIWREQSFNHFMSFIRAVITSPESIAERYKRFESSNFSISNIKKYISGKESLIRRSVTGYETNGIYQTSTISCTIPYYSVVLPQNLYDLLEQNGYDLDLAMVKRDPSILPTCMYVCSIIRNTNPGINCTTISDQQSKGFNQDQDGDRNAVYFLRRKTNNYDSTKSFSFKVAKMELALAFRCKRTLIGTPRYFLSETSLLKIARFGHEFMHLDFFAKTYKHDKNFMNDASAGYLSDEYDEFQQALIKHNETETRQYITVGDLLLKTNKLPSIVTSGAKGNVELIQMLLTNISSDNRRTLHDRRKDMLDLCNKYITSSQDLSRNGRKQFASLYAAHDLISHFSNIYINKCCFANYNNFASAGTLLFNNASLELFLQDLIDL